MNALGDQSKSARASGSSKESEPKEWSDWWDDFSEDFVLPLAGPFMVWEFTIQTSDKATSAYLGASFAIYALILCLSVLDDFFEPKAKHGELVNPFVRQPLLLLSDAAGLVYPTMCIYMIGREKVLINQGVNPTTVLYLIESAQGLVGNFLMRWDSDFDDDCWSYWDWIRGSSLSLGKVVLSAYLISLVTT